MITTRRSFLLIILLILAIYANSLGNEFVWDDVYLIVKNPSVMSWNYAWLHFAIDLYHSFSNYYRPIQMISYMMDFSLWQFNSFGYHITNILLHIAVSISLFALFKIITQEVRIALIGTLLYSVHPAHTAAVTYIAGRADTLAALFSLLSLILFHHHFKEGGKNASAFLYIGSLMSFLLALLSKESAVILPVIILFYRLFFITDDETRVSQEIIKFHYLSPFIIALGVYLLLRMNALNFLDEGIAAAGYPLYSRLLTSLKSLAIYFGIIFFPLNLHMERDIPYVTTFFEYDLLLSLVLLILVICLVIKVRKISKHAFFGSLFFLIALLPVMNIYPIINNMAEHWLYIPMIGVMLFTVSWTVKIWNASRRSRPILAFLLIFYLLFFSARTLIRNFDWRDEYTIYHHTFNHNPRSIKILNYLGNLYNTTGDLEMAVMFHKKALEINPREYKTHLNLGLAYEKMDMPDEALAQYKLSARYNPRYAKAYFRMGNIYAKMGELEKANSAYLQAVACEELLRR